jgi:hypothetical protein
MGVGVAVGMRAGISPSLIKVLTASNILNLIITPKFRFFQMRQTFYNRCIIVKDVKKILRFFLGLIFLVLILFSFYLYKLHSLAVEGNKIFALRCTKVNPPLINYKNEYPKDEIRGFLDVYISGMKIYVPEETKWLEIQKEYISRWDFKLLEPWYMKELSFYQWKMYEAYRDDAKYMIETYESGTGEKDSETKLKEASAKFWEARQRRDEYGQKYFDL